MQIYPIVFYLFYLFRLQNSINKLTLIDQVAGALELLTQAIEMYAFFVIGGDPSMGLELCVAKTIWLHGLVILQHIASCAIALLRYLWVVENDKSKDGFVISIVFMACLCQVPLLFSKEQSSTVNMCRYFNLHKKFSIYTDY